MKPFEHIDAQTIDEAVELLNNYPSKLIAGGTDLLGILKNRILSSYPELLVNIKTIPDLDVIEETEDGLKIGALAKLADIADSPLIKEKYPMLAEAAESVAVPQIRNMATIGGNLVNAVPSADGAIPLIVLDATVNIYGTKGTRSIDLIHFFLGPGQTVLEKGEILTEIVVPPLSAPYRKCLHQIREKKSNGIAPARRRGPAQHG